MSVPGLGFEATQKSPMSRDIYPFGDVTHLVLDDYTTAIAELRLDATPECDASRLALKSAASRLLAQAQAHRALQAPKAGGTIELGEYLQHVCAALNTAHLADQEAWLTLAIDEVWLDVDRCWLVGLIIAELIRTSVCPRLSGEPPPIRVKIVNCGWQMVGTVAIPGGASTGMGPGRGLVEALSAALGGTVEWGSARNRCWVWFELPIVGPRPGRGTPKP
jgi:hypothetical protein